MHIKEDDYVFSNLMTNVVSTTVIANTMHWYIYCILLISNRCKLFLPNLNNLEITKKRYLFRHCNIAWLMCIV